ncbi:MAG: peptidylprolyl isomerase [Anaerolineae bacterium]
MKQASIFGLAALLAVLALAGCGGENPAVPAINFTPASSDSGSTGSTSQLPGQLALVNGQPITREMFEREMARFEAGQAALGFQVADQAAYQQQVLNLLIEQELIRQLAAEQGIVIDEAQIDAEINSMIAETGQAYFDSWLISNFYSLEEFRELVRMDMITDRLIDPIISSIPTRGPHVHARHILVNSPDEAASILNRLQAGEDFAALAAQYSVDVTTRSTGGDLGWFPRGVLLVPEVEEAAFNLAPGQLSGVIESALGYHVVQTLETDPDREIEPEARQRLITSAIENWRSSLRSGADVQQLVSLSS